jgi:chitosanase
MNLTKTQKSLIERVINTFETGKPDGNYGAVVIFNDGPHNIRQITYGRSQTTEYGNLRKLVQAYVAANGLFSAALAPFAEQVGSVPLTDNDVFKNLLRRAGREDPVMRKVQDRFFEEQYFRPAMKWADTNGFTLPLAALVIYDSFIHSGSILWPIRMMFPEAPPAQGGDEHAWLKAYVNARHKWLANHPRPIVRKTVYRTECFKREIARGNWDLRQVPIKANGVAVKP